MKFVHLSDLHLGKKVNEFPMIEDQKFILKQILKIIDDEKPDAVIIAGDIYDKAVPSTDAVNLFDDFLNNLAERKQTVFAISGNHDSAERIAFGSRLFDISGIHFSPAYNGDVKPFTLEDENGPVNVYMLPFIKPASVRGFFPDEEIHTYTEAVNAAVRAMNVDENRRNILVTHQFVTGASRSDSEEISVGGSDNVDAGIFDCFDYVALGHIHGPQNIGSERIRYCGTPLKYSFSESKHDKSVTIAELGEKGVLSVRTVSLTPMHDMAEIKGTYDEIMFKGFYENTSYPTDYMHITLTDENDIPNVQEKLRTVYKNLMKIDYDNRRTRHAAVLDSTAASEEKTPYEHFAGFYKEMNGIDMTAEQSEFINKLIEEIWEG